jgi:hypothetical protein
MTIDLLGRLHVRPSGTVMQFAAEEGFVGSGEGVVRQPSQRGFPGEFGVRGGGGGSFQEISRASW